MVVTMTVDEFCEKLREVQGAAASPDPASSLKARVSEEIYEDEPEVVFRFAIHERWERRLFCALCRRYNLRPYRYEGQDPETIMLRASRQLVDGALWPEHLGNTELFAQFVHDLATRVIEDVLEQRDHGVEILPRE